MKLRNLVYPALIGAFLSFASVKTANAQSVKTEKQTPIVEQRALEDLVLDAKGEDIKEFLINSAKECGANVSIYDNVSGKVYASFKNISFEEILNAFKVTNGIEWSLDYKSKIYTVKKKSEAPKKLRAIRPTHISMSALSAYMNGQSIDLYTPRPNYRALELEAYMRQLQELRMPRFYSSQRNSITIIQPQYYQQQSGCFCNGQRAR